MGAVLSALLLGGSLAGAFFAWLLRRGSAGEERAPLPAEGPAAAPGAAGGDPRPAKHEQGARPREPGNVGDIQKAAGEHHQESNGFLVSESSGGDLEGPTWKLQNDSTQDFHNVRPGKPVYSTQLLETESLALSGLTNSVNYSEILRSESLGPSLPVDPLKGQKSSQPAVGSSGKFPSDSLFMDKPESKTLQVAGRDSVDHDDWEMVPRQSGWGDASKSKSSELSPAGVSMFESQMLSPNQGLEYGRGPYKDANDQEEAHLNSKRVAAVSPMSQQVNVQFQIHYITTSDATLVAITGDHETLGSWDSYIPLQCGKDWFWSSSVPLPVDTVLKWKFVVVENGLIVRWEECSDRLLEIGHEDTVVHKWWGCH